MSCSCFVNLVGFGKLHKHPAHLNPSSLGVVSQTKMRSFVIGQSPAVDRYKNFAGPGLDLIDRNQGSNVVYDIFRLGL